MTINGVELKFKLTNAATAERYEEALNMMQRKGEELEKHPPEKLSDAIRSQVELARDFMDAVFGEGTWANLGTDPNDLDENVDLVSQVIEESARQGAEMRRKLGKYDPKRSKRHA